MPKAGRTRLRSGRLGLAGMVIIVNVGKLAQKCRSGRGEMEKRGMNEMADPVNHRVNGGGDGVGVLSWDFPAGLLCLAAPLHFRVR